MGLDCSHDAFHGAYSAFNRFRQAVSRATGGSFPPHEDRTKDEAMIYWDDDFPKTHPGLAVFLQHSDCDGSLTPGECKKIADEMETILPALDAMGTGGGHLERAGGIGAVARTFIAGCRLAKSKRQKLLFR